MSLFNRCTKQEIAALLACRDQRVLLTLFDNILKDTYHGLALEEDDVKYRRLQGRAAFLEDFIQAVETSSDVLARMK